MSVQYNWRTAPTALYRLYDETDTLLYVGISNAPTRRIGDHRWSQPYLAYQKDGLNAPEAVRRRTDRYQMESDAVGRFLAEEIVFGAAQMVAVKALYERYEMWCRENDEQPLTKTMLGKELGRRQYASEKGTAGTRWYRGMGLRPVLDDDGDDGKKTRHIDITPEQAKDPKSGAFSRSPYTRTHGGVTGFRATRATQGGFDDEIWPPGWDDEPG